jgi:hypothetical protein
MSAGSAFRRREARQVSPGATFERVYAALKAQLRAGRFPPGSRLEPAQLCEDLASSVTPIRDALHRLTGERLLDTSAQHGFCAPYLTEVRLRQLYAWQEELVLLALRASERSRTGNRGLSLEMENSEDPAASLFLSIAKTAGNAERTATLANVIDRLGPTRALEPRLLGDTKEEADSLRTTATHDDPRALRGALLRYHRRRQRAVPDIVALLGRAV